VTWGYTVLQDYSASFVAASHGNFSVVACKRFHWRLEIQALRQFRRGQGPLHRKGRSKRCRSQGRTARLSLAMSQIGSKTFVLLGSAFRSPKWREGIVCSSEAVCHVAVRLQAAETEEASEQEGNGLDSVQELLHLYCAMGLEHASDLQLSLVGRCKDVSVAAALVRAAMHCLDAKFHSSGMRFLTGEESTDAQTEAAFKASLQEVGASVSMFRPPLSRAPIPSEYTNSILSEPRNAVHKVAFLTSAAKALGMADRFSAVIGSLRCYAPPSTSTQLVAAVDRSPEPAVQYPSCVRWFCRSKPAQIAIPDVKGVVLLGSLAHAIDEEWLRWRGVSHIVCCLGKFAGRSVVHEAWSLAEHSRKQGIEYLEWNPSNRQDWEAVSSYCACLHEVLGSKGSVVLFHCVNGKDRSPMAVFAYMRLRLGMAKDVALQLLEARRSTDEKPLFDVYANHDLPYLTTALEQESEWGMLSL